MSILFISLLILIATLFSMYFAKGQNNCLFIFIVIFGIFFSITAIGIDYLFNNSFGASTPVNVKTENQTDEALRVYSVVFWDNEWNGKGNYAYFDSNLNPNEKSNDFWFENDETKEFWIIAKNQKKEIVYLEIFSDNQQSYNLHIINQNNIDPIKISIAKQLTSNLDKSLLIRKALILLNYLLISLILLSVIRKNTAGNKPLVKVPVSYFV